MNQSVRNSNVNLFDEDGYIEPKEWTIIAALDRVLNLAERSGLGKEFWETAKNPIDYLTEQLELTKMQIVFLAVLIEDGEPQSWAKLGRFLGCSRLSMMVYTEEIEDMLKKRWIMRKGVRDMGSCYEGYALVHGVITALRHNEKFEPENLEGLNVQELVDKSVAYMDKNPNDLNAFFEDDEYWLRSLCEANASLPLCREALAFDNVHNLSLLFMVINDYAQWAGSDNEGLSMSTINDLYPDDIKCGFLRRMLKLGTHPLIERGFIENKCEEGIVDAETFVLTDKVKKELLAEYKPNNAHSCKPNLNQYLTSFTTIKEKNLFFNDEEQEQIERLTSLLTQDNLPSIQKRLEEEGMRKGFACLFYGGPGTGKTESVLQIARKTGRNIMQVDIAGLRDKWVGESEKNIKAVFARYKRMCMECDVTPILFFNEADGIFSKRTENIERSVEKMDNAMQNIILQEIENLDGILIATTNLTSNLDSAFERRFLFKVEFHKPTTDVKAKIWCSMIKDMSEKDAHSLASKFDFSGGQIENIARQRTIDFILSGKYADIDTIEGYCRNELLENKKVYKPVMGFAS